MRLWSLHPKYLDTKGLVALWREGLLARKVLLGKTRGYKHHPQLERFKNHEPPVNAVDTYLIYVYEESVERSYKFNRNKIGNDFINQKISVTDSQLEYELKHLKHKLKTRSPVKYNELKKIVSVLPNPIFKVIPGEIESWEVVGY
jgi:hypothetical protein